jgi:hypothetical protein
VSFLTEQAFRSWFRPKFVVIGKKTVPLADFWLSNGNRRQYQGLVFSPGRDVPGYYNLWRGFAV